jgi:diguanylate cyclase (GGDEF)-like protein
VSPDDGFRGTSERRDVIRGAIMQMAPFMLAASAVPLTSLGALGQAHAHAFVAGLAVLAAAAPLAVAALVGAVPRWLRWTVLVVVFVGLSLVLRGVGDTGTGGGIVLMVPVVWMALYEGRREVVGALVIEAMSAIVLITLDPGAFMSVQNVRRITVFLAVSVVTAWAVARVVARLARSESTARRGQQALATVADAVRAIRASDDARATACEVVMTVSGASSVLLMEQDGPDALAVTAVAGPFVERLRVMSTEPSVSVLAYSTGEPVYVGDARDDPRVSKRLMASTGARSVLAQPFSHGGRVRGVIVAGWDETHPTPATESTYTIALLAEEVGSALERADLHAALQRRATTDPLTAMANRRVWREGVPAMMTGDNVLCVAVLDLDHFKTYNDTRGHLAGDTLLADLGRAWEPQLRPRDLLVRWGGEEFAVALPQCSLEDAQEVIERLRASVPDGQTVSAGLAHWDGTETIEALMSRADAALYQAKNNGRDRTVVAVSV